MEKQKCKKTRRRGERTGVERTEEEKKSGVIKHNVFVFAAQL